MRRFPTRIFLLRRRHIAVLAALVLAAGIFYAVAYPSFVTTSASERQLPIYCVQRDQKLVSVSFDAAWGDAQMRQ